MSLNITVKSAANLPKVGLFTKTIPDAIAELTYKGAKRSTKPINSLNPRWNRNFEWSLETAPDHDDVVSIEVFHFEKRILNKLLGKTSLLLSDCVQKTQLKNHVLNLEGDGKKEPATITLDVVYSAPGEKAMSRDVDDAEGTAAGLSMGMGDSKGSALIASSVSASTVEGRKQTNQRMAARASLPDKKTDFHVRVHVIEGHKLTGVGIINPLVKVTCGNEVKGTSSRKGTCNPLFDETIFFSFKLIPKEMFDMIVEIRVFNSGSILSLKQALIGSFKFDLGMVFDEPDHSFIHKWLLLTDPDDPSSGAKGYLKFSIKVIYPGVDPKPFPTTISREKVDIESNLLRPAGVRLQTGTLSIKVYRAEDMPQMDPGVKRKKKGLVDPYCIVQFAGRKEQTKVISNDQDPEWNQQINLPIRFPSMCERISFQLKDEDLVSDDYIGACFLNLSDISTPGFLPTFGPAFITVYGSSREFRNWVPDKYEEMNKGKLEGVAYRGRIMVEINMELGKLPTKPVEDIKIADQKKLTPFLIVHKYTVCCAFFSAVMVEPANKPVEFEVSIGNFGNKLDTNVPAQSSTTPPTKPVQYGEFYHHLPWMNQKPCVVIESQWEDNCFRIESMNLLNYVADMLEVSLVTVKKMNIEAQNDQDQTKMTRACDILKNAIEVMCNTIEMNIPKLPDRGSTLLDRQRRKELRLLLGESRQVSTDAKLTIKPVLEAAEEYISRLRLIAVETQNSVPDVVIWMLSGKKRVASYRIPSQHLMYSRSIETRGKLCGKLQDIQLKPFAADEEGKAGALLRVNLWLGLEQDKKYWQPDDEMIKQKEEVDESDSITQKVPPLVLTFPPNDCHKYQLWVYLYQARDMYGSDKSGLSDPYTVVSFDHYSAQSRVCKKSVCPTWDQTLIIGSDIDHAIRLYGDPDTIQRNPPPIILEFFDKDAIGENEFMGIVKTTPTVQLPNKMTPVRLEWYEINRYGKPAGEVLTAFELFLDDAEGGAEIPLPPFSAPGEKHLIVPKGIHPELQKTRIEVLCWGVRNMKSYELIQQVKSPLVEVQCGGQTKRTKHITNTKINPNFPENTVLSMDVMMPKEREYAPPLTIRVYDKRSLGYLSMVGVHVVKCLEDVRVPDDSSLFRQTTTSSAATLVSKDDKAPVILEDPNDILDMDPDNTSVSSFDWWSKYYCSVNNKFSEEDYVAKGHDKMTFYEGELEDYFNNFNDFTRNFPLYRGKGARDPDDSEGNVVGLFKGAIKVYPLPEDDPPLELPSIYPIEVETIEVLEDESCILQPSTEPVDVVVRVYIIKGIELRPMDPGGKSDSYVRIKLGNKQIINDKDNYIANSLDPLFGRMFELPAKLPIESMLTVTLMDHDHFSADDLIGETKIDLENRFFSQHRPTCGLPATFAMRGSSRWRDHELPKDILNWYCCSRRLGEPNWISHCEVMVNGESYTYSQRKTDRVDLGAVDQQLALKVLHELNEESELKLVPEHFETRTLKNPMQPGMSQGKLHMWVDIFPKSDNLPPPVDITPRKPEPFTLRIVIWNTSDVEPKDRSFDEDMSDIYVKGWLRGQDETQKTDVHYRSMDGSGNFNWRFVFHFDYLAQEKVMVISKKEHFYSLDKTADNPPPQLKLQVWDNDWLSPDDFIGAIDIDLLHIPAAAKSSYECGLEQLDPKKNKKPVNLFTKRRTKGWWPVIKQANNKYSCTGKVEMELEIVTLEEEQLRPAGKGRDEPNMNPKLDPPHRPSTSFLWFTSPWRTFKFIIWKHFKWHIILSIVAVLIILIIVAFIYSTPEYLAQIIINRILPF